MSLVDRVSLEARVAHAQGTTFAVDFARIG